MFRTQVKTRSICSAVQKNLVGAALNIALEGRLDTTTAPQLEAEFAQSLSGVQELNLDFAKLEYLSSAGLRDPLRAEDHEQAGEDGDSQRQRDHYGSVRRDGLCGHPDH